MDFGARQARQRALETLEDIAKRFRGREDVWPFRVPHEPPAIDLSALRPRPVLRMEWAETRWELTAMTLPSGIHLYCDADGHETRALASVKRGNPSEADGFFLERLAESRGHAFGIELSGPPPDRVHSAIGDREFLADVFVELFEGTEHEAGLKACATADTATEVGQAFRPAGGGTDFRAVVADWLERVLTAPTMGRRQPRLRDEDPLL